MVTADEVIAALDTVRDPELDESIVELGFVEAVEINGCAVAIRLRLPTPIGAENLADRLCADARSAVCALPEVRAVWVTLPDRQATEEITAVAARQGFRSTFPGLADEELDQLRATFRRKAFVARQDLLARALLAHGQAVEDLAGLRLGDLPDCPEARAYRARRAELGYDLDDAAPLLLDPDGLPVPPDAVAELLARGHTTRVGVGGDGGMRRSLVTTR